MKECGVWCVKLFERGGFEGMHEDKVSKKGQLACGHLFSLNSRSSNSDMVLLREH